MNSNAGAIAKTALQRMRLLRVRPPSGNQTNPSQAPKIRHDNPIGFKPSPVAKLTKMQVMTAIKKVQSAPMMGPATYPIRNAFMKSPRDQYRR